MTALKQSYPFKHYYPIQGLGIQLVLAYCLEGKQSMGQVPAYVFNICLDDGRIIGQIDIRIGDSEYLTLYGGQIGYGISPAYRGSYFAYKACRLIKAVAIDHGMAQLWITCNTDNLASIKTCQRLGARLIATAVVPKGCELYRRGDRVKYRFLWKF